jgi:hypothetical protein
LSQKPPPASGSDLHSGGPGLDDAQTGDEPRRNSVEIGLPLLIPVDPRELKESFDIRSALLLKAIKDFARIIPEIRITELVQIRFKNPVPESGYVGPYPLLEPDHAR